MTHHGPPDSGRGGTDARSAASRVALTTVHAVPRVMGALAAAMRERDGRLHPAHIGVLKAMHAGPVTPSDLAEYLEVSLPTISRTVAVLERHGWIERDTDEHDRRRVLLRLTTEGRTLMRDVLSHGVAQLAEVLAFGSDEELAAVERGMESLNVIFARAQEAAPHPSRRQCRNTTIHGERDR